MKKAIIRTAFPVLGLYLGLFLAQAVGQPQKKQSDELKKKQALQPVVILDATTQAPRIIRNMEEYAPGAEEGKLQLDKNNSERVLTAYLKKNEARLGLKAANLKFRKAWKVGRLWVATFRQHYQNIPVYRSRIGLVALGDGRVISFGSNYDSLISLEVKPAVTYENALSAAVKSLNLRKSEAVRSYGKELVVWPNPSKQRPRHSLAWMFVLETQKPNAYAHKVFFVDARTGHVLRVENALREETLKAQVRGEIWPNDPTNPTEKKPFSYLMVSAQDKSMATGPNGHFKLEGLGAGTYNLKLGLKGPFVTVYRNSGTGANDFIDNEAKLSGSVQTGRESQLDWPASDEANAFYHVNKVRDWFLEEFFFAWECPWDRDGFTRSQIIVCVESGPEFNGMGGMGGIWLGSQGGKQWARSADVVYHEFTHNVILSIFDGLFISRSEDSEGYSMDEGFADYFACALTNDSILAENVFTTPRNLQNLNQYPDGPYALEGHEGGKIISGACWDFRCSIDKKEADQLVFQALNIMAAWPPEYYFSNQEESNFLSALRVAAGEQYEQEINQAFENHNLLPEEAPAPVPQSGPAPRVTSINPPDNQRAFGPTQIVIRFDTEINEMTYAGNIIVEREDWKGRRPVTCDIIPDLETGKMVTLKPARSSEGFEPLGMQTTFYIRLVSSTSSAIKGENGQPLDGDGDGQPGGDYIAKFWIID